MKCLGCGKDFCYDCQEKKGVRYNPGVFTSGSGDGFYCHACDKSNATSALHQAFVSILELRNESDRWNEDFQKRKLAAEKHLAEINPN